jgi:hypothetical protein
MLPQPLMANAVSNGAAINARFNLVMVVRPYLFKPVATRYFLQG